MNSPRQELFEQELMEIERLVASSIADLLQRGLVDSDAASETMRILARQIRTVAAELLAGKSLLSGKANLARAVRELVSFALLIGRRDGEGKANRLPQGVRPPPLDITPSQVRIWQATAELWGGKPPPIMVKERDQMIIRWIEDKFGTHSKITPRTINTAMKILYPKE